MDTMEFARRILLNLPFDPNSQQVELIAALARFCSADTPEDSVFILAGYAGTGKTSVTGALVRALREARVPVVLMAPTGRAAKVFGAYARYPCSTIHRRIYKAPGPDGPLAFGDVNPNTLVDAVFIVDEASMIADGASDSHDNLLADLIHYVYSSPGCRMILMGDTAQLPPVGTALSPALDAAALRGYGLRVSRAVLTMVARQGARSGILYNATWLRRAMKKDPLPMPELHIREFDDVAAVTAEELPDLLQSDYSSSGIDETILITRSNKRATSFNAAIRVTVLERESELECGERLLIAKNNYLWSAKVKGVDFIANGDIAEVTQVYATEEKYSLRFADVRILLPYRSIEIDAKIVLDTLYSDTAALGADASALLARSVFYDPELFPEGTSESTRLRAMRGNPYLNALQVKYAYAVTCHKAQGGQWENVYVDMGGIAPEAMQGLDFYRWLYTAATRATRRLSFVNAGS